VPSRRSKGLLTPVPDGRYELRSFAVDEARNNVSAFAVFHGTHTGEGGPVPPTGNSVAVDYVYVMDFDGDRIRSSDSDFPLRGTVSGLAAGVLRTGQEPSVARVVAIRSEARGRSGLAVGR
jgi:hypothetical protein